MKISNRLLAPLAIATMTASSYAQLAEKNCLTSTAQKKSSPPLSINSELHYFVCKPTFGEAK
jgi:hypothetical protein